MNIKELLCDKLDEMKIKEDKAVLLYGVLVKELEDDVLKEKLAAILHDEETHVKIADRLCKYLVW